MKFNFRIKIKCNCIKMNFRQLDGCGHCCRCRDAFSKNKHDSSYRVFLFSKSVPESGKRKEISKVVAVVFFPVRLQKNLEVRSRVFSSVGSRRCCQFLSGFCPFLLVSTGSTTHIDTQTHTPTHQNCKFYSVLTCDRLYIT